VWSFIVAQAQETVQQVSPEAVTEAAQDVAQGATKTTGPGGGIGMFAPLILIFAVFYFLMLRPQQKQEKKRREMLSALAKGDRVVTSGGICGTVIGLSEKSVVLRVSDDPVVKMEFLRGAVSQITARDGQEK
jgi:preprotein translocase subunit YajC